MQSLAERLLPPGMVCAVSTIDDAVPALLPDEAACVASAVLKRRREFAVGRLVMRRAIRKAGFHLPDDRPIVARPDRSPDLPEGIRASLSHSSELCIAVATTDPHLCPGVDIERMSAKIPDNLGEMVGPVSCKQGMFDPLLAFSAKEALYKSQFPESGEILDFRQAALLVAGQRLRMRLACGRFFSGCWGATSGHLLTLSWRQR